MIRSWLRSRAERIQNLVERADLLNEYQYYFGEPDSLRKDLERFRSASAATVKDAVGGVLLTKTLPGVVSWPPQLSVTRRLTLWTPVTA